MKCPKCKSPELKPKTVNNLFTCPKCGGLWLEGYSKGLLHELNNFTTGGHKNPQHDSITGLCPNGHGILIRGKVKAEQSFYLEKCPKCYGIWFDKDEWHKVSENQLDQNLLNIWSTIWQKEQREKKKESEIQEDYKSSLSPDLYDQIINLASTIKDHPEKFKALTLFNETLKNKPLIG